MENSFNNTEGEFNIKEELAKYLRYWRWFVVFSFISILTAYLFLRYETSVYKIDAAIMIKDNQKSGISKDLAAFADLGIIGNSSANNPDNEIEIIKSRKILGHVVDSLNLQTSYFKKGNVKSTEIYKKVPFTFEVLDTNINLTENPFLVELVDKNNFKISLLEEDEFSLHSFSENIEKEYGHFKLTKTAYFEEFFGDDAVEEEFIIFIQDKDVIINNLQESISASLPNELSSIINLSIKHPNKQKAEAILDELIKQYNLDGINDKNIVSEKTINFINNRLIGIKDTLESIQDLARNYKTKNNITGLSNEGQIALTLAEEQNKVLRKINTELKLAKWVQESLENSNNLQELLPQNLGFSEASIVSSIETYNQLVITRNRLLQNAGVSNPVLVQLTQELSAARKNLATSINNLIYSLELQNEQLAKEANIVNSKVSSIPILERGFIDIARQQYIINDLYTYLLKKKEETSISLAITVPNAKIIDKAYANPIPIAPKKKIIYLGALIIGLLIPFGFIYVKDLLDTKIHTRDDVEKGTNIPFLGDIPHSDSNKKIVISKTTRSSTAEAFRLMRTNMQFMLPTSDTKKTKTIFITSTTSGEGKSFIAANLATALSLTEKKVLLLGMDLRAPKETIYLGLPDQIGVTNYLTKDDISIDDIKFKVGETKNLDVISSGVIPPNPAELLSSAKLNELFTSLQNDDYDYIIVDTAPVSLVTDTLLISKYADLFLYIIRANYLDKKVFKFIQSFYDDKKLPNMSVVLNDTDLNYGYGNTYGYGYGYGYGFGFSETTKKSWYKKLLGIS